MHDPIEAAKDRIRGWDVDNPRVLVAVAACLCRDTLDRGGLPNGNAAWQSLRRCFDTPSQGQAFDTDDIVCEWNRRVRDNDLELDLLNDQSAAIKLGVVTWIVTFLAKRFGLLEGAKPVLDFDEWRTRLCKSLDDYVGPFRDSWIPASAEASDES